MPLSDLLNPAAWMGRPYVHKEAFAALYHQAYRPVYRYVYALHGGPAAEVEDLVAETFLRAWTHRGSFDGSPDAAVGWLITIARRLVIDRQRRSKRQPAAIDLSAVEPVAPRELDAAFQRQEHAQTVAALLGRLAEADRELLTLRYILGWPVRRIADHQQKSQNAVSVALRRALDRAREQLAALMEGRP